MIMKNFFCWMGQNPKFSLVASTSAITSALAYCLLAIYILRGDSILKVVAVCTSISFVIILIFLAIVFEIYMDVTDQFMEGN